MLTFTGYEYLLINVANHFGLDKELFETRIQWARDNMDHLETLMDQADEPILFIKTVRAIRDARNHVPSGHMVDMDATSSGMQIMGAIMNCIKTCDMTGLIDPNRRADAYTAGTQAMSDMLGSTVEVIRDDCKGAMMKHFYGSKLQPKLIFGEDTDELAAFYQMLLQEAPGASELTQILLNAWQPYALVHEWVLPDGFHARCKVMQAVDVKVEVDELDHATFTHRFYENQGDETGLSVAANITHSIDGMLVREMNRRCNYDPVVLRKALKKIDQVLEGYTNPSADTGTFLSLRLVDTIASSTREPEEDADTLYRLKCLIEEVLTHKPFPIVCVHDCFKCHPNNMNRVRYWYKEMLAELAESDIMDDILTQIYGRPYKITKMGNIAHLIRNSNYSLS